MTAIFSWLGLGRVAGWLAIGGAIVAAVLLVLAGAKRAGRTAERVEQMQKINRAVKEKVKTDANWDGLGDADRRRRLREQRDELRELLRP